jgi:hypothetical protein
MAGAGMPSKPLNFNPDFIAGTNTFQSSSPPLKAFFGSGICQYLYIISSYLRSRNSGAERVVDTESLIWYAFM